MQTPLKYQQMNLPWVFLNFIKDKDDVVPMDRRQVLPDM
jgi:hypothetical protein